MQSVDGLASSQFRDALANVDAPAEGKLSFSRNELLLEGRNVALVVNSLASFR